MRSLKEICMGGSFVIKGGFASMQRSTSTFSSTSNRGFDLAFAHIPSSKHSNEWRNPSMLVRQNGHCGFCDAKLCMQFIGAASTLSRAGTGGLSVNKARSVVGSPVNLGRAGSHTLVAHEEHSVCLQGSTCTMVRPSSKQMSHVSSSSPCLSRGAALPAACTASPRDALSRAARSRALRTLRKALSSASSVVRKSAHSRCWRRAATNSGVQPLPLAMVRREGFSRSSSHAHSVKPLAAARCSAVEWGPSLVTRLRRGRPELTVASLGSAPRCSSSLTVLGWPYIAATISGVKPQSARASGILIPPNSPAS
mmetsp:Transcript_48457/g.92736  ORF Transcript_48457/g.92736 Transcript_48457/m.92736 type:complete len:310 (+) Transcript_48457:519-1448(+)